jgi:ATP-dependent DNA helicase DinG
MADTELLDKSLKAVVGVLGGENREGQIEMMHAVDESLRSGQHLLVQAGTGTGKSVAYLLPAILFAMEKKQPVVISTATLALQRQLVSRDLPRIADALAKVLKRKPTFAVAKGRHHYICKQRLNTTPATPDSDDDDQAALFASPTTRLGKEAKRVRTWAFTTETGDREDLEPAPDLKIWRALSVTGTECIGASKCPFGEECFTEKARAEAEHADVVITNHAMLVIHALEGVPLLPDHCAVIVDEGHELADRVTGQATQDLSSYTIERAAKKCRGVVDPAIVVKLEDAADGIRLLLDEVAGLSPKRIVLDVAELGEDASEKFIGLKTVLNDLLSARDSAQDALADLQAKSKADPEAQPEVLAARSMAKVALGEISDVANRLIKLKDSDVAWLDKTDGRSGHFQVAPLSVSHLLSENLFAEIPVVITSATLTLGGKFDAMAKDLGLLPPIKGLDVEEEPEDYIDPELDEDGNLIPPKSAEIVSIHDWRALDVGSPFDAASQGVLYIPAHLPPPGRDGLSDEQLAEATRLIIAAGGRTLALFSSWRAVEKASEHLQKVLPETDLGIKLLVQRKGDVVADLVKQFASDTTSVLLGTISLWQGVDVPGEACSLVIIDRIPFPRPDDPLVAARQQRVDRGGGSGFRSIAVPRAALLLAQGAGRLLRTQKDRGMVAVLDSRLESANYAGFLVQSLPPFWKTTDPEVANAAIARLGKTF